jgi:hypothetical protein
MRRLMIILLTMVLLTSCTSRFDFDGFDPTTTTLRWLMKQDAKKN